MMIRPMNFILCFVACAVLMACQSSPSDSLNPHLQTSPSDVQGLYSDDQPPKASEIILTLNAGDVIYIHVFGDDDLSGTYEIDPRGLITLPLIGDIHAAGTSPLSLQNTITEKLNNGFIINPQVSIEVKSLRPFYILGEVRNPGTYPIAPNMDMFKAIATAGGLTPRAKKGSYIIYRGFGSERQSIKADDATPVLPDDSILIEERFF